MLYVLRHGMRRAHEREVACVPGQLIVQQAKVTVCLVYVQQAEDEVL